MRATICFLVLMLCGEAIGQQAIGTNYSGAVSFGSVTTTTFNTTTNFVGTIVLTNVLTPDTLSTTNGLSGGESLTYSNGTNKWVTVSGTQVYSNQTATIAGTANQITSSAGAQDLTVNRTWTLSVPNDFRVPSQLTVTSGQTNSFLTASRIVLTDGNKALASAVASGAVPINADGTATTAAQLSTASAKLTNNLGFTFSGGGSALSPGAVAFTIIPYTCTVKQVTTMGVPSGSAVIELYTCTTNVFDGFVTHPVAGDKITSATPPTITSGVISYDKTLSGWTTNLTQGNVLAASVTSATTITNLNLSIQVEHAP